MKFEYIYHAEKFTLSTGIALYPGEIPDNIVSSSTITRMARFLTSFAR